MTSGTYRYISLLGYETAYAHASIDFDKKNSGDMGVGNPNRQYWHENDFIAGGFFLYRFLCCVVVGVFNKKATKRCGQNLMLRNFSTF